MDMENTSDTSFKYSSQRIKEILDEFKNTKSQEERVEVFIKFYDETPTKEEIVLFYKYWAETWDEDQKDEKHDCPKLMMEYVTKYCPNKDISILDVCCGTGIASKYFNSLGYTTIDAIDGSDSMLEKARLTKRYRDLYHEFLEENSPVMSIPKERLYDLVFCSSSFVKTILTGNNLPGLVEKIVKGGIMIMTEYSKTEDEIGVFKMLNLLEQKGEIEILLIEKKMCCDYEFNFIVFKKKL